MSVCVFGNSIDCYVIVFFMASVHLGCFFPSLHHGAPVMYQGTLSRAGFVFQSTSFFCFFVADVRRYYSFLSTLFVLFFFRI